MGIKLENYEMIDIEKFIFVYLFQLICRPSVTYGIQSVFNKLCKPSIEVKFLVIVCQNFFVTHLEYPSRQKVNSF